LSAWLALLGSVVTLPLSAQSLNRVPPETLEKVIASLDKHLLPEGAKSLEVERDQVVAAPGITLVPVRFEAVDKGGGSLVTEEPPPTKFYCGIYQLVEGAPATFLLVLGSGQSEMEECVGLKAIGAAIPHAAHGDLILIYDASTLHEKSREPVILSWESSHKRYVINDDLTEYVGTNSKKSYTVYSIRSLLASRPATRP